MSPMGNLIVIAILAVVIGLCIRSMWRSHKNGGCSGNCGSCGGGCGCGGEDHNGSCNCK